MKYTIQTGFDAELLPGGYIKCNFTSHNLLYALVKVDDNGGFKDGHQVSVTVEDAGESNWEYGCGEIECRNKYGNKYENRFVTMNFSGDSETEMLVDVFYVIHIIIRMRKNGFTNEEVLNHLKELEMEHSNF